MANSFNYKNHKHTEVFVKYTCAAYRELTPHEIESYRIDCNVLLAYFKRAHHIPSGHFRLPNGLFVLDLQKYIWQQVKTMRFHFERRNDDLFLYQHKLLTNIKNHLIKQHENNIQK